MRPKNIKGEPNARRIPLKEAVDTRYVSFSIRSDGLTRGQKSFKPDILPTRQTTELDRKRPNRVPYLKADVFFHAKSRITWLLTLMLTATITGSIISNFEDSLAVLPALVAFIPMLMGAGGNAGAQSSTVIIREMAIGEISARDMPQVIWREIRIASICGLVLGFVNFIRVFFMHDKNIILALVVSFSLWATLVIAKVIGGVLPLFAKKLKMDPATMSAPIVTTIVDCTALIIFLSVARAALT